jgi:succinate-semialdehyde dehydrogenase/glutarate-semialdehyde dehydrogenase
MSDAPAFTSINPATEDTIATYDAHEPEEVEARLERSVRSFARQKDRPIEERARRMRRAAEVLQDRAEDIGRLMTREMGKPINQAQAEAEKCAWVCRYYAEHAADFLADEEVETAAQTSFVAYEPLGPLLAVMPWNYPFWQVFRFAAPALMAGNVVLLKHAPNTIGCALAIEEVLLEAGFEEGALQALLVDEETVADVIADDRVQGVTLTGSVGAGQAVAKQAAAHVKPTVLELGGSDPLIVCADADLDRAASVGCTARMQNSGQSCIAAKRFIVERPVLSEFTNRLIDEVEDLAVGDPKKQDTDVGPLAREDLLRDVHNQVERAIGQGAVAVTGGHTMERTGYYYKPTVLTDVEPGTVAFDEEIFGPVASVVVADDADHAVELANATRFGLGASVFTEDREKGTRMARELNAGCAFVNQMTKSDPRLPFGGVKESGYGRELSHHGIREFVNAKTIWVE